jgi:hypothetical protein
MKRYIKPIVEVSKLTTNTSMLAGSTGLTISGGNPTQDLGGAGSLEGTDTGGDNLSKSFDFFGGSSDPTPQTFNVWED